MKKENVNETAKFWLKKEMRPYQTFILFLACLIAFSTIFSLAFAYMVRYLINSASNGHANQLWIFSFILLGVLLLKIVLKTLVSFLSERLRAKMTAELRSKIFAKILRSDYRHLQEYHSGDMLNRLTTDIQQVVSITVGFLPAACEMIVQCVGAIAALLTIDPLFTGIYVVSGIGFGAITALFRRHVKKKQKAVLQADGEFRSFMQEGLSSIMTLKAYGAEGKSYDKATSFASLYYRRRQERNRINSMMSFIFSLLSNFGLILAVVWCSISVLNGNTDYGSILSVILLLMQLQHPFTSFSSLIPAYYSRIASGERLAEIDELPCEKLSLDTDNILQIYNDFSEIILKNIEFTYDRDIIFTNANAIIKKGDIICLTGLSGSGKSTIFKLLLNVFTPTNGEMYLTIQGQEDIQLTAKERGLFAYVPQGNFLFSGTIYENLTFFAVEKDKDVLQEKMKQALKIACADFVWELPENLQTCLGESGEGLSEGQLQRLTIARALLSERPILLLDEATSALDGETEKQLLKNIKALQGKTCIMVTHRPAALDIADRVLNVENGQINEVQ